MKTTPTQNKFPSIGGEALQKFTVAVKALKEIRDTQGKVCDNFELCNHRACRSSYSSWYIAGRALKKIGK